MNRLLAAGDIDDRKAAHTEPDVIVEIETVVIRPTMPNRRTHSGDQRLVH
jgi:hypothetical protein